MNDLVLENERLRVVVDAASGAVREVVHRRASLALIAQPDAAARHPFMIILTDGTLLRAWRSCTVEQAAGEVRVQWTLDDGLHLQARLHLDSASGELHCRVELRNPRQVPVAAVAYPYIAGIGGLGATPDDDELVHPYATGFRVRNPLASLPPATSETEGQEPVVLGLYPEGFSGSTMQFMAYSAVGRGGFYVGTEDGGGREKWLNFYRHADGDLRLAVWHSPTDYAARRDVAPDYATVLAPLDGGTWYDAADRYKLWAVAQSWVAQGPLWARDDIARWLFERVGVCTFGINARHDRAAWLEAIDRLARTPVLHLLGVNWTNVAGTYTGTIPGPAEEWFPARFHPRNLAVIRANGDYLIPFQFDLLQGHVGGSADAAGAEARQVFPTPKLSRDGYIFPFLCPVSAYTRERHVLYGRRQVADEGVAGLYYDISLNNVRHICLAEGHGHEAGDTVALTSAYRTLLDETGAAAREVAGGTVIPQGAEMINELMIGALQFYQARAEASPQSPFEAMPYGALLKDGRAEKIPLFAYVYHEYGPLRLDGWAKLSREQGDFVYFILGRIFVQGGLIELNYEFSALEDVDGQGDRPEEHYFAFAERHYAIDPPLAAFVGRLARARLGRANRYLAYGAMLRPAPLTVEGAPTLLLDYFAYNCPQDWASYEERATMTVPTVLQGAWRYREESVAWVLVNLASEERVVHLDLAPPAVGPAPGAWTLTLHQEDEAPRALGSLDGPRVVTLTLPSRCPVTIEAVRP